MSKNLYALLGVEKQATQSEIKTAYKRLAMKYHPDKMDGSDEIFKDLNEAYRVLSDEESRSHYDRTGKKDRQGADYLAKNIIAGIISEIIDSYGCDGTITMYVNVKRRISSDKKRLTQILNDGKKMIGQLEQQMKFIKDRENGDENVFYFSVSSKKAEAELNLISITESMEGLDEADRMVGEVVDETNIAQQNFFSRTVNYR